MKNYWLNRHDRMLKCNSEGKHFVVFDHCTFDGFQKIIQLEAKTYTVDKVQNLINDVVLKGVKGKTIIAT